jgi:hypothetical protein
MAWELARWGGRRGGGGGCRIKLDYLAKLARIVDKKEG